MIPANKKLCLLLSTFLKILTEMVHTPFTLLAAIVIFFIMQPLTQTGSFQKERKKSEWEILKKHSKGPMGMFYSSFPKPGS